MGWVVCPGTEVVFMEVLTKEELKLYNEQIKSYADAGDANTLAAAKSYTNGMISSTSSGITSTINGLEAKSLAYRSTASSSKSLDDYNSNLGIYKIGSGTTPTDMPLSRASNESVLLVVTKAYNDGSYCRQDLIYTTQNITLTRYYNGSEWSEWQETLNTETGAKAGGRFTEFDGGVITESAYGAESFLRADLINAGGEFKTLTVNYPAALTEDAITPFSGGSYYDARYAANGEWTAVNTADTLTYSGAVSIGYPYWLVSNGKLLLGSAFGDVSYYESAEDEVRFRAAVMADIAGGTASQDIISLFNGGVVVQRRGAYGFRIVAKQGANGSSLVTSDFITGSGRMVVSLEGSTAGGDVTLTVAPIGDDFAYSGGTSQTTVLTSPVYVGTYDAAKNFVIDATSITTPIYSVYTELAANGEALSEFTEITAWLCDVFMLAQDNVATVEYVGGKLDFKADKYTKSGGFVAGRDAANVNDNGDSCGTAVGCGCKTYGTGFAGGSNCTTHNAGAAIGDIALTRWGGAVGYGASSYNGGAVGQGSHAESGFCGGFNAESGFKNGTGGERFDNIQLGTGTNNADRTLQVYDYTLMNADGTIPAERIPSEAKTGVVLSDTEPTANNGTLWLELV